MLSCHVGYKLERKDIFTPDGKYVDDKQRYDLMQVVLIYISRNHTGHDSENDLISMLTDLLNDDMDASEKIALLETKHHLLMTDPIKKEVLEMCEYTTAIAEKNLNKGRAEGRVEGREEERLHAIRRMIKKDFDKEVILSLGYSMEEYEKAEQELLVHV